MTLNEVNRQLNLNLNRKIQIFFRYLKEKNIYNLYINNVKNNIYLKFTLKELIEKYGYDSIIDYSFDWDDTREGFDFWSITNDKWSKDSYKILENYYE